MKAFHQHIINIYFHGLPNLLRKHLVHQSLIYGPYVFEAKRHYFIVVKFHVGDEGGVLLVKSVHLNLVVS